jgi:hypothetical protein
MSVTGSGEHLECISSLKGDGPYHHGCLGFKFTVHWALVPYRIHDDGYVLTGWNSDEYTTLDAATIHELQAKGTLATPLPTYRIPIEWRVGRVVGFVFLSVLLIRIMQTIVRRRRLRAVRAATSPPTGVRLLAKRRDREIDDAIRPHLEDGETIEHQALAFDRAIRNIPDQVSSKTYLAALTDRRIVVATSKTGVFGMFKGERTVKSVRRDAITNVVSKDEVITIHAKGATVKLFVPLLRPGFSSENQQAFLVAVSHLFEHGELPGARIVKR